jgi:selenocysteine lyase/cysteine desulfurase
LQNKGLITLDIVDDSILPLEKAIEEKICPSTYLVICSGASNVTGKTLPIKKVGEVCKEKGVLFMVDGAQLGGHKPIDMKDLHIDMLCLAGHKGLYGIMGSGVLLLADTVNLTPLTFGGTGTESFNLNQPTCYPERLESGTLNLPAIASLLEGVKYVKENVKTIGRTLYSYTQALIENIKDNEKIKLYSSPNEIGIVAFSVMGVPSNEVADTLNSEYDIAVRGGLHCAPLMHKALKTDKEGLVRVSLAVQNSTRELAFLVRALNKICGN